MCLIFYGNAATFTPLVENAFDHNPHGFGYMYPSNGKVYKDYIYDASEDKLLDAIKERWKDLERLPSVAVHFRYQTRGTKGTENLHPFPVVTQLGGAREDVYMMHNGTFSGITIEEPGKSDTWQWARNIAKLVQHDPNMIHHPNFVQLFSGVAGASNKVLFMDGQGKVSILNKQEGATEYLGADLGGWVSNTYSLDGTSRRFTTPSNKGTTYLAPPKSSMDDGSELTEYLNKYSTSAAPPLKQLVDSMCMMSDEDMLNYTIEHPEYAVELIAILLDEVIDITYPITSKSVN